MSMFIAPAISVVTGLLNQQATQRATKLKSNIATAQQRNDLADQSYLMVVQMNAQNPPTRYEYDIQAAQYRGAIAAGNLAALKASGLFTDAYIASIAAQHPPTAPNMMQQEAGLQAPAGSSVAQPAGGATSFLSNLPWWVPVAGLGGVALLAMLKRRSKKR